MRLISAPLFGSLNGKVQPFLGEWYRKLQTNRRLEHYFLLLGSQRRQRVSSLLKADYRSLPRQRGTRRCEQIQN
jgi:hypothetical protein